MTELRCKKCDNPMDLIPIWSEGSAACPSCDQVYRCIRCGQYGVFVGGWAPPDHPVLSTGVCETCRMRERSAALPTVDVEAIRAATRDGVLPAVKLAWERLGWPLREAVLLVHVLGQTPNQVVKSDN